MKKQIREQNGNILVVAVITIAILALVIGNVISYVTRSAVHGNRNQALTETELVASSLLELLRGQWLEALNESRQSNPPLSQFDFISESMFTSLGENSGLSTLLNPANTDVEYEVKEYTVVAVGENGALLTGSTDTAYNQAVDQEEMSSAGLGWYLGIVEVERRGRNPVSVRIGRILPFTWESIVNFAMAEFIFGPDEGGDDLERGNMSIFPGPPMHVIGRVYSKGNLFYGHETLNLYDVSSRQGAGEDSVTTSGQAINAYPAGRAEEDGTPDDSQFWNWDGSQYITGAAEDVVEDGVPEREIFFGDNEALFDLEDANPNNDGNRELIERPIGTDTPGIESERFYNKADVRILVDSTVPPYLTNDDGLITGPNPARVQVLVADYSGSSSDDALPSGETNVTPDATDEIEDWSPIYQNVWESLGLVQDVDSDPVTNPLAGETIEDNREAGARDSEDTNVYLNSVDVAALADGLATTVSGRDGEGFNGGVYISDISAETSYARPPESNPQEQGGTRSPVATYIPPEIDSDGTVVTAGRFETSSSEYDKAVRLKNGAVFPDSLRSRNNPNAGLTIVSDNGVYIQGDYNTGRTIDDDGNVSEPEANAQNSTVPGADDALEQANDVYGNEIYDEFSTTSDYDRRPAMVAGDAIMVLSNAWDDANSSRGLDDRVAEATTINTAILAGNVKVSDVEDSDYYYDGGMENFPRFLEKWRDEGWSSTGGKVPFNYYGSMILMFRSKHFNGQWGNSNVYNAPYRRWYYENRYLESENDYDADGLGGPSRHSGPPPIAPRANVEVREGGYVSFTPGT